MGVTIERALLSHCRRAVACYNQRTIKSFASSSHETSHPGFNDRYFLVILVSIGVARLMLMITWVGSIDRIYYRGSSRELKKLNDRQIAKCLWNKVK